MGASSYRMTTCQNSMHWTRMSTLPGLSRELTHRNSVNPLPREGTLCHVPYIYICIYTIYEAYNNHMMRRHSKNEGCCIHRCFERNFAIVNLNSSNRSCNIIMNNETAT